MVGHLRALGQLIHGHALFLSNFFYPQS
jgi:hypothetical protein